MTREVTIVTPENVTITYELAGLGTRAVGYLLDVLVLTAAILGILVAVILALWGLISMTPRAMLDVVYDFAGTVAIIVLFSSMVAFQAGYFIYYEMVHNGQTPGKRRLGLRVVREEGTPLDPSSAVIRNLIRIVELSLGLYIISLVSILASHKYKRLGDYAAGTIVVKERSGNAPTTDTRVVVAAGPVRAEAMYVRDVHLLTREEIAAIRRFVERRFELAVAVQEEVARQIAEPIISRLGIVHPTEQFSYANFLEEVFRALVEEKGIL